jgi:hypothetical protein
LNDRVNTFGGDAISNASGGSGRVFLVHMTTLLCTTPLDRTLTDAGIGCRPWHRGSAALAEL